MMKLSKLQELYGLLDKRAVLKHFLDAPAGALNVGMDGVQNRIGLHGDSDLKLRVLLGILLEKIEDEMKASGIDMTPEKPNDETDTVGDDGENGQVVDTTAKETETKQEGQSE